MSESDIIRKVKLMSEMQRMAEEAQAEADALKDEIKAFIAAESTDGYVYPVSLQRV